ncbi:hypothetical protein ACFOY4_23225 [Actinomadura syzygii]|nr:hypothetical protein [Actinomadura syzygii]
MDSPQRRTPPRRDPTRVHHAAFVLALDSMTPRLYVQYGRAKTWR